MNLLGLGRPPMNHLKSAATAAALLAGTIPFAFSQTEPQIISEATEKEGVRSFDAGFFAQYNPVTAFDMVSRVSGFEIEDGEERRGFGGTAGNVLVNGKRPSSKAGVSDQLKRIPAGSVLRIELLSGSAADVDVRGQTQLVNVVLAETTSGGSPTTYVFELREIQYSQRIGWTVQLTRTFSLGEKADLTLDIQTPNLRGRGIGYEVVRDASGKVLSYRDTYGQPNEIGLQGAGVLKWRPTASDTVNFNAEYGPTWNTQGIGVQVYSPSDVLLQTTAGWTDYTNNYEAEFGGDWEHRFSPALSAKLIGLVSQSNVDQEDVYQTFSQTGLIRVQSVNRTTEAGERVGRGFLSWKPTASHTLDIGVEGAFNYRDTTLDIFNDFGSGPVPQFLAVADARVEEVRAEPFITDIWKLTDALTLETGFVFEVSRINQSGDEIKEREFSYPKPRMIATWQKDPSNQLRISLIRDVSQLDFAQFASSLNIVDAFSILGNPDLEPEKAWKLRGEWERRLGKNGAVTLAVFHDQVEDVEDLIVIGSGDAYGNLGDGTRTGIEVRGTSKLGSLIPNAELRYSGLWQDTSVTDAVTGEDRRFAGEQEWKYNFSFRQELPAFKAAWGATVSRGSDTIEYKRDEDIFSETPNDRIDLFVETTVFKGITLRASASNITHTEQYRLRTFYLSDPLDPLAAPRSTADILRTEDRKFKGGPNGTQVFAIRASGTF